jgi:hypothetical protein
MSKQENISVITVRQIDGAVRYLAVRGSGCIDPARIETARVLACADVAVDGTKSWEHPLGCRDTPAGRAAIKAQLAELADISADRYPDDMTRALTDDELADWD